MIDPESLRANQAMVLDASHVARSGTWREPTRRAGGTAGDTPTLQTCLRSTGDGAMKGIFAWMIGIPIPIILILYFVDVF